jgi:hypothetical protein
MLSSSP